MSRSWKAGADEWNKKKKLTEQKRKLFQEWTNKWLDETEGEDLDIFFNLFKSVYQYTLCVSERNKHQNFKWKKFFLIILFVLWGWYAVLFMITYSKNHAKLSALAEQGLGMILLVLLCSIIAEWPNIKKYQETWARHSWQIQKMEAEMMRFVSGIEPYHRQNKCLKFMEKILEIWDQNEEKFVHNMEEKEKELMDVFHNIKDWRK
ncbi:MAG: hypothetical protein HFI70_02725 [Lachnospiraceae bacterium]|nr:hypothetical protein [Lachnospiraceae bacterium]